MGSEVCMCRHLIKMLYTETGLLLSPDTPVLPEKNLESSDGQAWTGLLRLVTAATPLH